MTNTNNASCARWEGSGFTHRHDGVRFPEEAPFHRIAMFIGQLKYVRVEGEESFVGRPVYKLTEPFAYMNDKVRPKFMIVANEGLKTDFASIPEWFGINPRGTLWAKATVIHDAACKLAERKEITYREADAYLFYAMEELDAPVYTKWLFWTICRINHLIVK